jgi:hypothetical protein
VYLLLLAVLSHETLVVDVGEEKSLVDGDVGGVLVGGVDGALVRVPFLAHVRIATLLLVVSLLFLIIPILVFIPVTFTSVTEPSKSLGPPTVVLVQRTSHNPVDALDHLISSVSAFFTFPKSVSPFTQILQHIGGTNKRKQLQ